ncbi:MAG: hypothetical protein Q9164_004511, partial [Protoblastenia rupestris]
MPVASAAAAYKEHLSPLASSTTKLGSPSVSNGQGINQITNQPMGLDYLRDFLNQ